MSNLTPAADQPYYIQSKLNDLVLDIVQGRTDSGAMVIQWPLHTGPNQQWQFESTGDGGYNVRAVHSNLYLQMGEDRDNFGYFIQAEKNNQGNQRFVLSQDKHDGVVLRTVRGKAIDVAKAPQGPGKAGPVEAKQGVKPYAWDATGELSQSFMLLSHIPEPK